MHYTLLLNSFWDFVYTMQLIVINQVTHAIHCDYNF